MTNSAVSLVPPRRLGALLAGARADAGRSVDELAVGSAYSASDLLAIEAGARSLTDAQVEALLATYGVEAESLVPARSELVIDLDGSTVAAGGEQRQAGAPTADEVLATYLSLVYALRHATPGSALVLRDADLDVLARVLELTQPDVEKRLHALMVDSDGTLEHRVGLLRNRLLLPVVGVVVAATAVGTVLFVQARDDGAPAPTSVPAETELGPASVQTPGGQVIVGDGIPIDQIPEGAVNLGEPQVQVREPDGSVSQTPRQAEPTTTTSTTTTPPATGGGEGAAGPTGDAQVGAATTVTPGAPIVVVQEGPVDDMAPGEVRLGVAQTITNPDA